MTIINDMKQDTAKAGHEVITTGFGSLDALIGGWHRGELVLIGGHPAMGKTAFITSSLINLSVVNDIPAAVFSLDEKLQRTTERIRHSLCEGMGAFESQCSDMLSLSPIVFDYGCKSIKRVRRQCSLFKEAYGIRLVYIDSLKRLYSDERRFESREKEVMHIVNELKAMATDLDLTVICSYQIDRDAEILRPNIEHFGHIPLACVDTLIAIYFPEDYWIDLRNITELLVLKSKYAEEGCVQLKFKYRVELFYEHVREETNEYVVYKKLNNRDL